MPNLPFLTGLIGSFILVTGAAWPDKIVPHPTKSIKNWLLTIGTVFMFTYAVMGYLTGGAIFFIFLQSLVILASILMMANTNDTLDLIILSSISLALILTSLFLFEDHSTIFFILGLTGVALGYTMEMGSIRRQIALTAGSILIAIFSYLTSDWIFFWLNIFFAIFAGYYTTKGLLKPKNHA